MPLPLRKTPAKALLALAAATALMLMLTASTASSEGQIVVHGSSGESHLRLTVSGEDILVSGPLGSGAVGCKSTSGHSLTCPVAGAGSIELQMGSSDDKVEVLDPLPIPLTVHLGAGSDKLIGNDEADTCYSEGTKRNRCIGGGGNDICITGELNSDCVGGPGDDLCQHGAGSDGCFGGTGNDVCEMGAGQDGCHGGPGNDRLLGGPAPDQLYGGSGIDYCDGGPGVGRSSGCERGPGG
jgi:Ca2+-binding RTX toxin-like protein